MYSRNRRINDICFSVKEPPATNCLWLRSESGGYVLSLFNNGEWQDITRSSNIMKKLKEIQESIPARLVLQNNSEQLSLAMNANGAEEKTLSRVDFPIVDDNNVGLMTPDML